MNTISLTIDPELSQRLNHAKSTAPANQFIQWNDNTFDELPSFEEIVSLKDANTINYSDNKRMGSYTMAASLLYRLAKRQGVTSNDILLLLYLIQIANADNEVHNLSYVETSALRTSDGSPVMCHRTFYSVLDRLKRFGIIQITAHHNGKYDLKIFNKYSKKEGYVDLNSDMFIPGKSEYDAFCTLPAKAKLLYMYLHMTTNASRHKRTFSFKKLLSLLNINTGYLIDRYIDKLKPLTGELLITKNAYDKKNSHVHIRAHNLFPRNEGKRIRQTEQPSYFRRTIEQLIDTNKVQYLEEPPVYMNDSHYISYSSGAIATKGYFIEELRVLMKNYSPVLKPSDIFNVFAFVIRYYGSIGKQVITSIRHILESAITAI